MSAVTPFETKGIELLREDCRKHTNEQRGYAATHARACHLCLAEAFREVAVQTRDEAKFAVARISNAQVGNSPMQALAGACYDAVAGIEIERSAARRLRTAEDIAIHYVFGWKSEVTRGTEGEGEAAQEWEHTRGGFMIGWGATGTGYGTLAVHEMSDGTFSVDTECMGQEFCEDVLLALARKWKEGGEIPQEVKDADRKRAQAREDAEASRYRRVWDLAVKKFGPSEAMKWLHTPVEVEHRSLKLTRAKRLLEEDSEQALIDELEAS